MRVGFDARLVRYPGVGRYIRNALQGLSTQSLELVVYVPDEETAQQVHQMHNAWKVRIIGARSPGIYEQLAMTWLITQDHLDLFHAPHYVIPVTTTRPIVVTIHDLALFHYPDKLNWFMRLYYGWMIRQAIHRSRIILCVSHFIAEEIRRVFKIPETRIRVVPNSVAEHFRPPELDAIFRFKQAYNLDRYILFVGTWKPWKNVGRLLEAFQKVKLSGYTGTLVLAGKPARHQLDFTEYIQQMSPSVRVLGEVAESDLPVLYGAADVLVMPSLYEGFGLPALEAMACGTPVVVARAGPLPEVVGDAGVYCDPLDVDSIAHAIKTIVEAPDRRVLLANSGKTRAKIFSVGKMGQLLAEAYHSALEGQMEC
jgi:glycosyltransferase involved in cell wall biosynthesis